MAEASMHARKTHTHTRTHTHTHTHAHTRTNTHTRADTTLYGFAGYYISCFILNFWAYLRPGTDTRC
jgi:hypothetical protein